MIPDDILESNKVLNTHSLKRQFARTPYAVSFLAGGRTFVLLTLHVLFGTTAERIPELKAIADWIRDWADELHGWNHSRSHPLQGEAAPKMKPFAALFSFSV